MLRVVLFYIENSALNNFENPNSTVPVLSSMTPSDLLLRVTLQTNWKFEVCTDTSLPCETFSIGDIASAKDGLNFCPLVISYAGDLCVPTVFYFWSMDWLTRFCRFRNYRLEDVAFIGMHLYLLFVTIFTVCPVDQISATSDADKKIF